MSELNAVHGIGDPQLLEDLRKLSRDPEFARVDPPRDCGVTIPVHSRIAPPRTPVLRFKRLALSARLPTYGSAGAAGFDIYAAQHGFLEPGARMLASTGWAVEVPQGYGLYILPRSGYAAKEGVTVLNGPGLVDSDFRGEVRILLQNHGKDPVYWTTGARIAQAVLIETPRVEFHEVDELTDTTRGSGGFGSTGR